MATNLRGVMAALLTPFDQQQALDKASLRRLVQFNIQQGIDGLYVGGSTGEAFVQSLSEREQVLEIVAEEAKGQIKLIAHVGCVSTAESQQLAASAKRYGFDAVSAVTPFYYPFSFEEHCDHYRAIIDSGGWFCRWWCTTFQPEWGKTDPGSDQHTCYVAWRRCAETDLWRSLSDGADPS